MKSLFYSKPSLAFTSIALSLSFHFAGTQTLYTPGETIGATSNTNIEVNISVPLSLLNLIGYFRLGTDLSQPYC
jgi:hypothetical protein